MAEKMRLHDSVIALSLLCWLIGVASCHEEVCRDDCLDDPAYWGKEAGTYRLSVGDAFFVVPDRVPPGIELQAANNNLDIIFHDGLLFLAWRTAPNHFASSETRMCIMASSDMGETWQEETCFYLESDMREPRFLSYCGKLQLMFFEAGTNPLAFEPKNLRRSFRLGPHEWSEPQVFFLQGESRPVVPWDVKVRFGRAWLTGYAGAHYLETAKVDVLFYQSDDGLEWRPVGEGPAVWRGGVSEVAFEFDEDANLWAVGRNEDGDDTGYGSQLFFAERDDLANWQGLKQSDPERYDSPELFRHGKEIYLAARRDIGGPFGPDGNLVAYSLRPKRSALYRINQKERHIEHLQDIPGVGDTAFFAVRRTGRHEFLLANYTSPLYEEDITWFLGQTSPLGTYIYLMPIRFIEL